ncbi:chromosome partitioning protein [Aeromicrobium sp. Root344]|uniref:ParA family protein n=1 Tax=Aeromicrobium sp. Root344 TaxID=1736521 RepID=UPI0006F4026A|nr:ParA family protein [Aeromicrobium sp. Root344]KQV73907.1 chromosome partitioning protein [Aeromicrobium sp. Root344]
MATVTTTIAVANQKGGVAKTTTVVSLGAALTELKQRVLLVDVDPQGSLTFSLGIDPEDLEVTVAEVLLGTRQAEDAIVITDDGMHLLPANITLTQAEESLVGRTGREQRLRVALDKVADDYDWILIDCPPTLGILTVGALSASQQVLIPLQAETLSHRGVGQLLDTIHDVRQFINPSLEIMGVLPTMYDGRTKHAQNVLAAIRETYELPVVTPPIPKTIRFAEAPAIGRSVLATARTHKGAEAYRQVAAGMLAGNKKK